MKIYRKRKGRQAAPPIREINNFILDRMASSGLATYRNINLDAEDTFVGLFRFFLCAFIFPPFYISFRIYRLILYSMNLDSLRLRNRITSCGLFLVLRSLLAYRFLGLRRGMPLMT